MSRAVRLCLVAGAALVLYACAPRRAEFVLDTARVPAAELVRTVSDNDAGITGLTGSGSVAFESPEMSGSVFFTLALRKPDSLLLRFEGPFGMDAGFFFLSRVSYVIYNRLDNVALVGAPSDGGIRSMIPLAMTVDQILDAFTGTFRFPRDRDPSRYTVDGDQFRLSYVTGTRTDAYWVDAVSGLVTRYQVEEGGRIRYEVEASLPAEQDDLRAPRRIVATLPDQEGRLSIYYTSLTLNAHDLSFAYSIPRSARRRALTPR